MMMRPLHFLICWGTTSGPNTRHLQLLKLLSSVPASFCWCFKFKEQWQHLKSRTLNASHAATLHAAAPEKCQKCHNSCKRWVFKLCGSSVNTLGQSWHKVCFSYVADTPPNVIAWKQWRNCANNDYAGTNTRSTKKTLMCGCVLAVQEGLWPHSLLKTEDHACGIISHTKCTAAGYC